jgi:hypothetical protein
VATIDAVHRVEPDAGGGRVVAAAGRHSNLLISRRSSCGYRAFGDIGTTFRELDWKDPKLFRERGAGNSKHTIVAERALPHAFSVPI